MAHQRFASVWDAIEKTPADAARMKLRSKLLIAVEQKVRGWNVNRSVAARRLGITQPRLNDLLHGKITKFSIDTLIKLADKAEIRVQMKIIPAANPAKAV
jgi:predicted XRE-type DNA-binding protein